MRRDQLEHILRAAGVVADEDVLIVVGSQAILASYPDPPEELTFSAEADLYPRDAPEKADLITGSLGEFSLFHETFGYHADGVSPDTAVLPSSWRDRLVTLSNENTRGVVGLCLSAVDIAISKLVAGREKDFRYVAALLRHGIVAPEDISRLLRELEAGHGELVGERLEIVSRLAKQMTDLE